MFHRHSRIWIIFRVTSAAPASVQGPLSVTNSPGRSFVRWYYTYGPRGAQFLNEHPVWKPVARLALLPAVVLALFLTNTSMMTKAVSLMIISTLFVLALYRKKLPRSGGIQ